MMMQTIRLFMFGEAASFFGAALIHHGVLIHGYEHSKAATAESVIGTVLLASLALTWVRPSAIRTLGLAGQGFALLGTFVGVFTILIGVGPRTLPDIVYHIGIILVLVCGLILTVRAPAPNPQQRA
jgi:hypothetical protein